MVPAYRVRYKYKPNATHTSYTYQRFFRALYGYTQVVAKANGRKYVYFRPGVLTHYPHIREGKNVVLVPAEALQPLVTFFKTGKNPAHAFEDLSSWQVSYSIEDTHILTSAARAAVERLLDRVHVFVDGQYVPARSLIERLNTLDNEQLAALYVTLRPAINSTWFRHVRSHFPALSKLESLM